MMLPEKTTLALTPFLIRKVKPQHSHFCPQSQAPVPKIYPSKGIEVRIGDDLFQQVLRHLGYACCQDDPLDNFDLFR